MWNNMYKNVLKHMYQLQETFNCTLFKSVLSLKQDFKCSTFTRNAAVWPLSLAKTNAVKYRGTTVINHCFYQ